MCEGYTDVIAFFLAGMPRAVATCGTALGEEHFRLLRNFARRVVLAYDADAAGQEGAGRVYEWERHHEVDVAVAALPAGRRPRRPGPRPTPTRCAPPSPRPSRSSPSGSTGCCTSADLRSAEGRAKAAEAALAVDRRASQRAGARPVPDARRRPLPPRARCPARAGGARGRAGPDRPGGGQRLATRTPVTDGPGRGTADGPVPGHRPPGHGARSPTSPRPGLEALRLAVHRPERCRGPVGSGAVSRRAAAGRLRGPDRVRRPARGGRGRRGRRSPGGEPSPAAGS